MRTLVIFETADEFFDAVYQGSRAEKDESVRLPAGTTIVSDGERLELQGDGMQGFALADDITIESLTETAFLRLGTSVYFT